MNDTSPTEFTRVSVAIPTLGREAILLDTLRYLLALKHVADEILVVDQTTDHELATEQALAALDGEGAIRWIRLPKPSITHAMNVGLLEATGEVVLFVDDDIIPKGELIDAHRRAHDDAALPASDRAIVAGRVLQPWHVDGSRPWDRLASETPGFVEEFIGCNFSVKRDQAVLLGGFDERFVLVAYRYEAEFAVRARRTGMRIRFAPDAAIEHLKAKGGGTRSFGEHLRTLFPAHTVGFYYYLLRARPANWASDLLAAPLRAIGTRFHLRNPWWIPVMLGTHFVGACWAIVLTIAGPKLLDIGLRSNT